MQSMAFAEYVRRIFAPDRGFCNTYMLVPQTVGGNIADYTNL